MRWRDNYSVPDGQRIAHLPAIGANLPEVDPAFLAAERERAAELARRLRDDA